MLPNRLPSTIAPPEDWGLPESFASWRPVQEDALGFLWESQKRIKVLSMPTGSGKSGVGMAVAIDSKKPTAYLTDSRALQNQLLDTFSETGLVDLRGRSNYTCGLHDDYTCEDGYAANCPYKGSMSCPASEAELRASASMLVVTNYDKWMHTRRFGQGLGHIQQIVCDEGHAALDALGRAMQITLHQHEIEETLGIPFPDHHDALFFDTWKKWALHAKVEAQGQFNAAKQALSGGGRIKVMWVRHYSHMRNLVRKLSILATANASNWVVEEVHKGYQFDPVQPGRYVESTLLLGVPSVLFMSATIRPKTLWMMGIGSDAFDYREFPSDFDPRRCPIYYVPTMRVDARTADLGMLWAKLDQIAAPRQDRNGLVHTVSYVRQTEILARSRFAHRMFINERGEPATSVVEEFVAAYPGAILVSPSIGQGFDFYRKAAEWQFICKVPFPPPSKILKARTEADPEYPYYLAMQKLVQMVGRPMRAHDDQAESFIADEHFGWFYRRYAHLAPKWFKGFVKQTAILPQPPPRLA